MGLWQLSNTVSINYKKIGIITAGRVEFYFLAWCSLFYVMDFLRVSLSLVLWSICGNVLGFLNDIVLQSGLVYHRLCVVCL